MITLLALALGCVSVPIKKEDLTALARADALVLDGCYDCLLEARGVYERVGVGKARPLVITRLFETQLLVALREKELAIDSAASLVRARSLAGEMPATAEAARYLRLVDVIPPDFVGTPRQEARQFREAQDAFVPSVNAELMWLKTSGVLREPVREYLSLAVDCATLGRPNRAGTPAGIPGDSWTGSVRPLDLPPDVPPLVAYRAAICDGVARNTLERLRTAVPRFIDTNFFLARLDVVRAIAVSGSSTNVAINIDVGSGNNQAHALLAEARERFPDSASLAYLSAAANQLDGDCGAALEFYDRTLALKSLHEDALLGRTTCLTYLKRPDEAIAGATRMIDLRTDNWGEAYYWRAWNLAARHDLDAARADIERAKTLAAGGQTFTLAGIIEHDQDALAIAESDLKRATMLDRQGKNCTAMWYLALVKLKQELRLESAGQFENSMICYDRHVQDDEQGLRTMQARTDLDPVFRARRIAGFETALKEDRSQYYAAAFNAANQSAHGGNLDKARVLIEIAAKDPAIGDKVAELREIIK